MPLLAQFPYYGPLGSGNYNVSLAIPGPLSKISKSYGFKASNTGVALPNTDFLKEFAIGNLGISDGFLKEMILKNLNNPIASSNEEVFKQFAKSLKIDISDISKFKNGNKFELSMNDINLSPEFEMTGFKAFEKTVFQSIFESQKPFMEIVKIAIESTAKAEDVIARAAVLLASNPLKAKSRKPIGNAGASNRPKAIGYKGATELKSKLREYESIRTRTDSKKNTTTNNNSNIKNTTTNSGIDMMNIESWKVLSTVYSTVYFNKDINYSYSYINIPADAPYPEVEPIDLSNEDPYDKYKPKSIIFGIYNSKGEPIDPSSIIKTIGLSGNNKIEVDTPFKKADWILRSKKWVLPVDRIEWPSFGTPNYIWEKTIHIFLGPYTIISKKKPSNLGNYTLIRYKEGDTNILTGMIAIPGDPMIASFDNIEYDSYNKYYKDLIDISIDKSELTNEYKSKVANDISNRLEIKNQVEATFNYGHLKSSTYRKVNNKLAFPEFMKKSYVPFQIFRAESSNDDYIKRLNEKKGEKPGYIWIDPEADYDMKVIRVDPITTIGYKSENIEFNEIKIKSFIKNKLSFISEQEFSISIQKNEEDIQTFSKVKNHFIENWNYEDSNIKNLNSYKINIWSEKEPYKLSDKQFYNWSTEKPKEFATASQTYTNNTITKLSDGKWFCNLSDGFNKLGDNTPILVKNNIITKWFIIQDAKYNINNMPKFGIDRKLNINYNTGLLELSDNTIPLYKIKLNKENGIIIDPSQITNSNLTKDELYANDSYFYGHGDEDDPQTLNIIKRHALTDLDTESYYIVEGILKSDNEFETDDNGKRLNNGRGTGGGGWYRLPHALGAASSIIKLIIDIATKMIPKITKLLTLFQNPFSFLSEILSEKLSKNFDFLSENALKTFEIANKLKTQTDKLGDMSLIKSKIDKIRIDAKEMADNILSGANNKTDIEQRQAESMARNIIDNADKQASELDKISNKKKNLVNKLRDFYKKSILSNYIFLDEKNLDDIFVLGGAAIIPFNLFGADLSFGLSTDINTKPLIKLIFPSSIGKFKNVQYLLSNDSKKLTNNGVKNSIENIREDILKIENNKISPLLKNTKRFINRESVEISFEDGTTNNITPEKLQGFVDKNINKYNFIYVTQEVNKELIEVNKLIDSNDQDNLDIAKEKLDKIKNDTNSDVINDMLKKINEKNKQLSKNIQPLLKALLGFITFPINVIADILKWLFDFFISLTNPFTLASKMKEFLSFEWLLKFLSPKYILDIFGFKFEPTKLASFKGKSGDISQYLSLNFIPKLPNYGKEQFKDLKEQPLRLLSMLKMLEKIINAFIDFIWALFGIESIMPSKHISISNYINSNLVTNIDGAIINNQFTLDTTNSNSNSASNTELSDRYIYEVSLSDGSIKTFENKEELNNYISNSNNIDFEIKF